MLVLTKAKSRDGHLKPSSLKKKDEFCFLLAIFLSYPSSYFGLSPTLKIPFPSPISSINIRTTPRYDFPFTYVFDAIYWIIIIIVSSKTW